jgi:DNA-binding IclR family transcriptional regulator
VLERTEESTFRVGLPIKAMAERRSYTPAIIESARRVLEDLTTAARTGAALGILTDAGVAYIDKRRDHSPVTTFAQTPRRQRPGRLLRAGSRAAPATPERG